MHGIIACAHAQDVAQLSNGHTWFMHDKACSRPQRAEKALHTLQAGGTLEDALCFAPSLRLLAAKPKLTVFSAHASP